MKKILVIGFALFLLVFGFSLKSIAAETGYINATATVKSELMPDVIDFDVEITTTSKESMNKAVTENSKISAIVLENLKKNIDSSKGDNIKTYNYNSSPVYKYNNNKKVLDYYQTVNRFRVHTKNTNGVGKIIDKAIADGATSINNISYSVSCYDNECNELLAQASKKAKIQAENIAKSMGSEITGIKSVSSSCSMSGSYSTPKLYMSKMALGSANSDSAPETNIELGTMTLTVQVNAYFYIK